MAETAGLVLGVIGISGLFKACIEGFDIVVQARDFGREFDLLCTQIELQRIRLVVWGESLGLVPNPDGRSVPYNKAVDRPDIRPTIENALHHLKLLLDSCGLMKNRFETPSEDGPNSVDDLSLAQLKDRRLDIFKERFESFKARIRKSQKQTSAWKVTRWAIHDLNSFRSMVESVRSLLDDMESITSSLDVLYQQYNMLVEEIASVSDTHSIRMLQEAASSHKSSPSSKIISDAASQRLTCLRSGRSEILVVDATTLTVSNATSSSRSFHTAHSRKTQSTGGNELRTENPDTDLVGPRGEGGLFSTTSHKAVPPNVPQHRRIMSSLLRQKAPAETRVKFGPESSAYGEKLADIKHADDTVWQQRNSMLVTKANEGVSCARQVFLQIRAIRSAAVPFISAAPVGDSLSTILASIEGPPDTPYQGGIFWLAVRFSTTLHRQPPKLMFITRIYHPNIDCLGNICADYQSWWESESLSSYMRGVARENPATGSLAWFSGKSADRYSLGALLTAMCGEPECI